MLYGSDIRGQKCPLCPRELGADIVFRYGFFYRRECWEKKGMVFPKQEPVDEIAEKIDLQLDLQSAA